MNDPQTDRFLEELGLQKNTVKLEQLLLEIENLLKAAPSEPSAAHIQITASDLQWVGAASAVISQWNSLRAVVFQFAQTEFAAVGLPARISGEGGCLVRITSSSVLLANSAENPDARIILDNGIDVLTYA